MRSQRALGFSGSASPILLPQRLRLLGAAKRPLGRRHGFEPLRAPCWRERPPISAGAAAVKRWSGAKITLRNGARIIDKTCRLTTKRSANLARAQRVNCSQVLPRQCEPNAGDEAQQDDNCHQQTPDSPELLVVHCFDVRPAASILFAHYERRRRSSPILNSAMAASSADFSSGA
jgi:hypothetical protein